MFFKHGCRFFEGFHFALVVLKGRPKNLPHLLCLFVVGGGPVPKKTRNQFGPLPVLRSLVQPIDDMASACRQKKRRTGWLAAS